MKDQISILRLITRLNIGGPARQALLLSSALSPRFNTTLACGLASIEEGELMVPGVTLRRVPLVRPVNPWLDLVALARTKDLIGQVRPDIVHTHMAKAGTIGRLASFTKSQRRSARPKTIHTFHGHVLDGYFSRLKNATFRNIEIELAKRTDVLIAVSLEIKDQLLEFKIGRPDQIEVVPLGLDLSKFSQLAPGIREDYLVDLLEIPLESYLVGIVGRLVPIKSVEHAIQAVREMDNSHLVIVGDGECRGNLEKLSNDLGLSSRVHFLGFRSDLDQVYSGLDCVILTSRNEGTPVSLIEAQASGRPVIASDVGGVRSVVDDQQTGVLVEYGNISQISQAIGHLIDNPGIRQKLGANAQVSALNKFSSSVLIDHLETIYLNLVSNR